MLRKIIFTDDGSHTIQHCDSKLTYHSRHGAMQESKHVFIQNGLALYHQSHYQDTIKIFEVGFGTGLNALLTLNYALHNNISIQYTAVEAYPLESELYSLLNYHLDESLHPQASQLFSKLHSSDWNQPINITPRFNLDKNYCTIEDYCSKQTFDVIYFDAFAPNDQQEVWTEEIFNKLYTHLVNGGVLVTYCAKGEIRRRLERIGFNVSKLPGPPGKREMICAYKNNFPNHNYQNS